MYPHRNFEISNLVIAAAAFPTLPTSFAFSAEHKGHGKDDGSDMSSQIDYLAARAMG